jgi:hypothetical protein
LGFSLQSLAQTGQFTKFLVVDRANSPKRYRFVPGQFIHLKNHTGEHYYAPLSRVLDSSIVLGQDTIALREIKTIYLEDKAKAASLLSSVLITTGFGYFAISTFNRTINDDAPLVHPSSYYFGVPALTVGYMIKLLVNPKVKIKQATQLKIIDLQLY